MQLCKCTFTHIPQFWSIYRF